MNEDNTENIEYTAIGIIHSPFAHIEGMPIQPSGAKGIRGTVEIYPPYVSGLKDLNGFSHVILLYHFHRAGSSELLVTPFLDEEPRGIFATRAPKRPNRLGLSVLKLIRVDGNILEVENVDILDGTPLIDIKPYVPDFDHFPADRTGWLARNSRGVQKKRSDGRFK